MIDCPLEGAELGWERLDLATMPELPNHWTEPPFYMMTLPPVALVLLGLSPHNLSNDSGYRSLSALQ